MSQLLQNAVADRELDAVTGISVPAYSEQGLPFYAIGLVVTFANAVFFRHLTFPLMHQFK